MMTNDTTGLNEPNVMWPASWILLGIVLAAILAGGIYLLTRYLLTRVPWKKLPEYPSAAYYGKNHEPNTALLATCLKKTIELLAKHCNPTQPKWTTAVITEALSNVRIYVMDVDKWDELGTSGTKTGRIIAGSQAGRNLYLGKNLAAFLHECAHRCEEVIDNERDMKHVTWVADGIRAAEDEFAAWLTAERAAS